MLLGSRDRRGADRVGAAGHGRHRPQLRDRPDRDERASALPVAQFAAASVRACRTPACPNSRPNGAVYPLTPDELATAHDTIRDRVRCRAGRWLLRYHPRTHHARRASRTRPRAHAARRPCPSPAVASLYQSRAVPAGRQRADDRRANERQRLEGVPRGDAGGPVRTTASRSPARRSATASHLLDVCVDYVGRDGVGDMREIAGRFATASTLPIVLDSTEPAVLEAGSGDARRPRR